MAADLALLWLAARWVPVSWIDGAWLRQVYPAMSRVSAGMIDVLPVSPTLLSAVLLLALLLLALTRLPRRDGTAAHRWQLGLAYLAVAVMALGLGFELSWGLAYRRSPLQSHLSLPQRAPNASELRVAFEHLAEVAADNAPTDGVDLAWEDPWLASAVPAAALCVADLDRLLGGRLSALRLPQRVRALPAGTLLRGGFAGIHLPWWREPLVDAGLPPVAALAAATHELSHAAGWAREAETDAFAIVAGLRCHDERVRFAAATQGLALLWAEVQRTVGVGDLERQAVADLRNALPAAVSAAWQADREAQARYLDAGFARGNQAVYDGYLRLQGVEAGMADYGRAAVLLTPMLLREMHLRELGRP